ncbi:MAG TPA: GntR family transcriptional regulator [Blastocatellia bacterium]|nr:GntR family transcriptional regulator [Blastocatellia bacterium]
MKPDTKKQKKIAAARRAAAGSRVSPSGLPAGKMRPVSDGAPAVPPARARVPALRRLQRPATQLASLSEQIREQIRRQIIHGVLKPGERLVELEIAAGMGVSQGPVREALQRLESEGLVERQSRTATYVTAPSVEEMYELSMIRKMVEEFAFRRTARNITPEDCDRLQTLVDEMREAAGQHDIVTMEGLDLEFHQTVCELSGSKNLLRVWLPLFTQLQRFIVEAHYRYFPQVVEIADGHQPLVDALRTRDPERAAAALNEHVMLSWSRINAEKKLPPAESSGTAGGKPSR